MADTTDKDEMANKAERTTAKVEAYNLLEGSRVVGNGWLIARYDGSRRLGALKRFGTDEVAARAYAALWNGPAVRGA